MLRFDTRCLVWLLICFAWAGSAYAGKFNRVLSIGDSAPAWGELKGVDGRAVDLSDFTDSEAVVIVFFANRCPMSQAYTPRLNAIAADYRERGVTMVAISVSQAPADNFEAMQVRARQQKFQFEYLQDLSQGVAKRYGATCTPHAFVLNRQRRIAYMGAIDDQAKEASRVEEPYLRWALDAVLAGQRPEIAETRQVGCDIEYVAKEPAE